MTAQPAVPAAAVAALTAFLEARTGQHMAPDRAARIDTMLGPILRERGLSLDHLATILFSGDLHLEEQLIGALVNNETSFFRDPQVFDTVLEAIDAARREGRRVRIWSAGCSTGQEPLSLAMALAEQLGASPATLPEIVASDISEQALAQARAGRYSQFEIQRGLPIKRALRWFETDPQGDWLANAELMRLVSFRKVNLAAPGWPLGSFDVILCRNVLLYLSPDVKTMVFDRLAASLRPGGILVLGAGETVIGHTRRFEPSRTLRGTYRLSASAGSRAA